MQFTILKRSNHEKWGGGGGAARRLKSISAPPHFSRYPPPPPLPRYLSLCSCICKLIFKDKKIIETFVYTISIWGGGGGGGAAAEGYFPPLHIFSRYPPPPLPRYLSLCSCICKLIFKDKKIIETFVYTIYQFLRFI